MLFRYTTPEGVDRSVDTESQEFQDRISWMVARGAPSKFRLVFGVNYVAEGTFGPTQTGVILWGNEENASEFHTDVFYTFFSTKAALTEVLNFFNWPPYLGPDYTPPAPAKPLEDWERADAQIGPPLPGQTGKYQSRSIGNKDGDQWVGPSGKVYQFHAGGFLSYPHWLAVG